MAENAGRCISGSLRIFIVARDFRTKSKRSRISPTPFYGFRASVMFNVTDNVEAGKI